MNSPDELSNQRCLYPKVAQKLLGLIFHPRIEKYDTIRQKSFFFENGKKWEFDKSFRD